MNESNFSTYILKLCALIISGFFIIGTSLSLLSENENGERIKEEYQEEINRCKENGGQAITRVQEPQYGVFVDELQACVEPFEKEELR